MKRPMRVSISLRLTNDDWDAASAYVVEAERLGVDCVWSAEAWGHDAVAPLAFLAARTSRIGLGTGIMQTGTRTPALVAMTAMSLASMSGNRFRLGLGVSGPQVIEGWHGIRFERPVRRLRETIDIVRLIARGDRASYRGEVYELPLPDGEGKALRSAAAPQPSIPIYLATLSPRSLETTGEVADGWLGTSFMPEHANVFFDHIACGAARVRRSLTDLDLQAGGVVAFSDDVERLIGPRKPGIAFTLGAMGSRRHNFYNEAYQRAGYKDVALDVQRLWLDGRREDAAARVPDELVLKTNLLGTEEMVRGRIQVYREAGITTLRVEPEGATLDDRLATLARVVDMVRTVDGQSPHIAGQAGGVSRVRVG
jgi:F420-dependent oxidoreductase-like protein